MSVNKRKVVTLEGFKVVFESVIVPLDDQLIDKLVAKGWLRRRLEDARALGFGYCEKRNSLMTWPKFEVIDPNDVLI